MTELLPGISSNLPVFATSDVVPFRLTPNMQTFLGPIFTEGILTAGIMAISRSLTEPEVSCMPLIMNDQRILILLYSTPWSNNFAFLDEMRSSHG